MAFLIQLLLPRNGVGRRLSPALFREVRSELTAKVGGLTAYSRTPAEGLWKPSESAVVQDEIVLFEVMTERLDRSWWSAYRRELERRFQQTEIVIRAQRIKRL